jgi:hypothetical protein
MKDDLEKVKEEICDYYCLWPEKYLENYSDPDEAHEKMLEIRCAHCPLANYEGGKK